MIFLGVDLAWDEGTEAKEANLSGVVALRRDGSIEDAGWRAGVTCVADWLDELAGKDPALVLIDAPLLVTNESGQRSCEREVSRRYGRWSVAAHSSNLRSPRQAGVRLREELERRGWAYDDGTDGPPTGGRHFSECYPYTTIVGAEEFGYDEVRPPYKKLDRNLPVSERRASRAAVCDELIRRVVGLVEADPPIDLRSHRVAAALVDEPSPSPEAEHKQREDLLDAAICAWTAALWSVHGFGRCQVLGAGEADGPQPTIIAPARPEQRGG